MSALPDVVGHEAVRASLTRAFHVGSLPRTLLFHGPAGVGKQRLGLWLGQLLVCDSPALEGPCGTCPQCLQSRKLEHPDIHWHFPLSRPRGAGSPERLRAALEKDRAAALAHNRITPLRPSFTGDVRGIYVAAVHTIRGQAIKKPSSGPRQVFVIGNAESLVPQEASPEAANALLKLLEEPPRGTTFILTTSEPRQLLPTIRSRAAAVHIGPLDEGSVTQVLVDAMGVQEAEARRAARLGGGAIGQALGYLVADSEVGPLEAIRRQAFSLLEAALDDDPVSAYGAGLRQAPAGARALTPLFGSLGGWLRDLAAIGSGADEVVQGVDKVDRLRELAARTAPRHVSEALDLVEEARWMAQGNVNPQLVVFGLVRELRDALGATEGGIGAR